MRPLTRPPLPSAEWSAFTADALLLQAFGPYCAICERRLPDELWVWHKGAGKVLNQPTDSPQPVFVDQSEWAQLLILCRNCMQAASTSVSPQEGEPLYPDDDLTFSLEVDSPFRYVVKAVNVRRLGRNGEIEAELVEHWVIVEGASKRAQATIRLFQLNGATYDDSRSSVDLTYFERMTQLDERVAIRTAAHEQAIAAAEGMLFQDALQSVVAKLLRQLAGATGFWSVWSMVLAEKARDHHIVREALSPQEGIGVFGPWRGATPSNPFPGTRERVL